MIAIEYCVGMRTICYFTNVYPAPSHTTMRREIAALEGRGLRVRRAAARAFRGPLVDAADKDERALTLYTSRSLVAAALCLLWTAAKRPIKLARALAEVFEIGMRSSAGAWKHLMYLGQACVLLRSTRDCSHVHANFGNATSIAIICRTLGGPPVSLRIHGPEEFEMFSAAEWAWKLGHAEFVAAISQFAANRIRACSPPQLHSKVRVLRCGLRMQKDADSFGGFAAPPRAPRLVCVARLEPRKGHDVLLGALAVVRRGGIPGNVPRCVEPVS